MQSSVGIHIPKIAFSNFPQTITTQVEFILGIKTPFTVTVRNTPKYIDVHTHSKFPKSLLTPGAPPIDNFNQKHTRHYIRNDEILQYAREKGFVVIKDAKELGIKPNSLRYHLNKLTEEGLLKKVGKSPVTYYPI